MQTRACLMLMSLALFFAAGMGKSAEATTSGATNAASADPKVVAERAAAEKRLVKLLDAPLLFVKRHSYTGIHIYDTYYKWPPGGGGIYMLENPQAPREEWRIRPVIDPSTPGTLGTGVYSHPELSWDAKKLLFCFKGEPEGSTSIYEINLDGTGLRRVSDPRPQCVDYKGRSAGQHDIAPCYLPDGRIVCLSTRPSGLVPCNNTGVAILHVMNADGSDFHSISVNNVNEFDPSIMPDGRILFGRWEYVDKNALTIQSLWTIHPDGTEETALFANNMVLPEAILDARAVPNSPWVVGTFAKHNATPRGSIAMVNLHGGKNDTNAIFNFEHPKNPTVDTGDSCEPWPLATNAVVFSGRPKGHTRNVLELMDTQGHRFVLMSDTNICLHSPTLVKARPRPAVLRDQVDRTAKTGRFFVRDIYQGLTGVKRGEVKWLRVLEETSRISTTHPGANPFNQTFLVSAALAFSVKHYLGVVPVDEQGSAYFEVPSGRAVYLQALDAEGRLVQSMRTFVQAAPGVTRSCIGCHEHKSTVVAGGTEFRDLINRSPAQLQPESWGSGWMDYTSRVQPILDRHCVRCHGGAEGFGGGLDLTGGWTEHFNNSYENLVSRRETQLIAYYINGIDCMNGTAYWSSQLFTPRAHGSGSAPLAEVLVSGHKGRVPALTRPERDLLMAWIDSNGLYHGAWNYTENGCANKEWPVTKQALITQMEAAGCMRCHGTTNGVAYFDGDWFNLRDPELSRILRAPLPQDAEGYGLGLCRDRKADRKYQRIQLLRDGYAHAVQPVDKFARQAFTRRDDSGVPIVSFMSTRDPSYQSMLTTIRKGREQALAAPRVDMPGAEVIAGMPRLFNLPPLPEEGVPLRASADSDGVVRLEWEHSARTIGLGFEVHRGGTAEFAPSDKTLLKETTLFSFEDTAALAGRYHYALIAVRGELRSRPTYAMLAIPQTEPPLAIAGLRASAASCAVKLEWEAPGSRLFGYDVYRRAGNSEWQKLTSKPIRRTSYSDLGLTEPVPCAYRVVTVSRRGAQGKPSGEVTATPLIIREPVFVLATNNEPRGRFYTGEVMSGTKHGKAKAAETTLDLREGGHLAFPHRAEFELGQPLTVECWVWLDKPGKSPVLVSCGEWREAGWFLQRLGEQWRWHVGGVDCDGGKPAVGRWVHLAAVFDGKTARLFEDGVQVAEAKGSFKTQAWPGDLHVGQYSKAPGEDFQVTGRISGVKLYHRPLSNTEVAETSKAKPQAL